MFVALGRRGQKPAPPVAGAVVVVVGGGEVVVVGGAVVGVVIGAVGAGTGADVLGVVVCVIGGGAVVGAADVVLVVDPEAGCWAAVTGLAVTTTDHLPHLSETFPFTCPAAVSPTNQ
jgi:hypothetical protein